MYSGRISAKEKNELLGKLQKERKEIEQTEIFREYQVFCKLPYKEKEQRYLAWNQYYKDVENTTAYQLFQAQRKALAEHDFKRVKELARESRQMREDGLIPELPLPKGTDPWEFDHNETLKKYRIIEKKIKELVTDEYVPDEIFG